MPCLNPIPAFQALVPALEHIHLTTKLVQRVPQFVQWLELQLGLLVAIRAEAAHAFHLVHFTLSVPLLMCLGHLCAVVQLHLEQAATVPLKASTWAFLFSSLTKLPLLLGGLMPLLPNLVNRTQPDSSKTLQFHRSHQNRHHGRQFRHRPGRTAPVTFQ